MSNTTRFSVSLNNDKGAALRALVESGVYPSLSSAFDSAVDNLLELERQRKAWWEEIARRCDEAEAHPERLLSLEAFVRGLEEQIEQDEAGMPA
ncbi:hypothetical protein T281_09340 [Rhodomicrobium udaipurense JA643]|uniref:Type II toxin-antitoxin system ParD family antitoxin n=1 Tax=Rhodomicrobium udaipurense TaxID=1202716 RepID=A0A8I1GIV7_9HYPH|nr:hypothetical protein [Rhodomicrobium udaipurense]KAI94740.1 hypothetical protein T281_09340 [Rhodomicrobium udaipurense JA643]MBJ7545221.1 hypothetical protein [Rhodomicrobium udaipurense]